MRPRPPPSSDGAGQPADEAPPLVAVMEGSPLPCWACDAATGRILAANRAAGERLGWSRESLLQRRMADLWVNPPSAEGEMIAAVSEGRLASWRQRAEDGSALVVHAAISRVTFGERPAFLLFGTRVVKLGGAAMEPDLRRLSAILSHTPDGVSMTAADGTSEYVSPGAARILGYTTEEITEIPPALLTHPDDVQRVVPLYRALMAEPGATRTFRSRVRHKSGHYKWIESSVTNLLHEPEVGAMVAFFRDVSEHVEAGEELLRARQRTDYILSATAAITYTCRATPPFDATFISDNVRGILGYSPEDFTSSPSFWADRIHPEEREQILSGVGEIFERGLHVHEYRFARADGTYCWVHDALALVRDEAGAPREMIGCMLDVTARREAEEARRRSEMSFRSLIEQLPIGVLVNRGGKIAYVNPTLIAMLGYKSPGDVIGRSPTDLLQPAQRGVVDRRIAQLWAAPMGTRNPPAEREMIRADGSPLPTEVEALRLVVDGEPALVVLARDLQERRDMLARMAASDRLAAMGTLAAGVAHEINNPLAFVQTNLSILSEELDGKHEDGTRRVNADDLSTLLRELQQGAARIRAAVGDLRLLSHPGAGEAQRLDVREVVESCIRMANREIAQRGRLQVNLEEAPAVLGDPSRLAQVVLNLLLNAAQALPEGAPDAHKVVVSTFRGAFNDLVIEVSDSGCGIPPDAIGRIFDPFFTTKPVGIGTGLGLSISHSIVQSMGGRITVESEVGRGSVFRVLLPAASAAPPAALEPAAARSTRRLRVLIIDDERALGNSMRIALSGVHDVQSTTSARDAIARIESGDDFDAILCDLMMPDLDGMGFHAHLVESAPALAARVGFLTGGAFSRASSDFLQRVQNPCLEKPFDVASLLRLIEKLAPLATE